MVDKLEPEAQRQTKRTSGRVRAFAARAPRRLWRGLGTYRIPVTLAAITATAAALSGGAMPKTIVAFGDSYFSGYGLDDPADSFPSQIERALRERGKNVRVINEGVPGETVADGLARLDRVLATRPALILLEFGANDGEMNLDPAIVRANLDRMLARIRAAHVRVLLCGAMAPEEYGEDYRGQFDVIYPTLAAKHRVPLYPFILDGVSSDSDLIQDDGEHPNEKGVQVMVKRILPVVEKIVR